jgi:aminoglycoside phosphotransferase family enzyme
MQKIFNSKAQRNEGAKVLENIAKSVARFHQAALRLGCFAPLR